MKDNVTERHREVMDELKREVRGGKHESELVTLLRRIKEDRK